MTTKIPGFAAEASLWRTTENYNQAAHESSSPDLLSPQWKCPCPPGLLAKASRLCDNPRAGGLWCNILDHCFDCFG
jgi:hypothetical protein